MAKINFTTFFNIVKSYVSTLYSRGDTYKTRFVVSKPTISHDYEPVNILYSPNVGNRSSWTPITVNNNIITTNLPIAYLQLNGSVLISCGASEINTAFRVFVTINFAGYRNLYSADITLSPYQQNINIPINNLVNFNSGQEIFIEIYSSSTNTDINKLLKVEQSYFTVECGNKINSSIYD